MAILFKAASAPAPFRLGASPQDVFAHPAWQRARQECLASLTEGDSVLLCGVPGTGKTMLLQDLCATLRAEGRSVQLLQRGDLVVEAAQAEVLLVDEAGRLSSEQIRQLFQRSNPVVLAGLPDLRKRVAECVGLIGSVSLDPLSLDDVTRLVASRLAASGWTGPSFAPQAVVALARRSGGLFRVVIILAGAALFFAEMRGAKVVAAADVEEAAAMREAITAEAEGGDGMAEQSPVPAPDVARWPRLAVAAVLAAVAVIGVAVHLGATAAAVGSSAASSVSSEPPRPVVLWPKRPLGRHS